MNVRAKRGFETQRQLATRGMHAAIDVRAQQQLDYKSPICIYGLCEALGVTVRFNDINMEGMYDGGAKPRIHVSALRPFGRRAFTCAHELGHHVFGHGSTIDELRDEQAQSESRPPNEVVADAFAAHLLMPALGIRDAFIKRGLNPNTASATEIYAVGIHCLLTYYRTSGALQQCAMRRRLSPWSRRCERITQPSDWGQL